MNRKQLSLNAIGLVVLFGVAGCAPSTAGIQVRPAYQWVGCSETQRNAVGGGTARVRICAESNARHYLGSNAGAGVVVAVMENLDQTKTEARWELLPEKQYLILIMPGGPGPGGQFRIVGPGNGANPNRVGNYYQCLPLHPKPDSSWAKFGDCHHWTTSAGPHVTLASSGDGPAVALGAPADGPAWITCETGCCTTDAPQFTSLDGAPSRLAERQGRVLATNPRQRR